MRTRKARNEIGQTITEYFCEGCTGWHDLNQDPEPLPAYETDMSPQQRADYENKPFW